MARLIPSNPCGRLLPLKIGALALSEHDPGMMTLIAPFRGKAAEVDAVLGDALGLAMPATNRVKGSGDLRLLWHGAGLALLLGAAVPELGGLAAVTDQSDASAVVRLEGAALRDVLARLVPVDLRAPGFGEGETRRTMLGHMTAQITFIAPDVVEVMVMRSMAVTLVHDLTQAMEGLAARGVLKV